MCLGGNTWPLSQALIKRHEGHELHATCFLFIQGKTELHRAAETGDVETVVRLLATTANVNSRTKDVSLV